MHEAVEHVRVDGVRNHTHVADLVVALGLAVQREVSLEHARPQWLWEAVVRDTEVAALEELAHRIGNDRVSA